MQDTRYGVRLMIGDVRGQGLPAVSMMSTVVGAFRENAHQAPSLHELARRLDTAAERAGEKRTTASPRSSPPCCSGRSRPTATRSSCSAGAICRRTWWRTGGWRR
ncbi:serine/threonine-protein phosphatase [Streptomyces sp. AD16]|nr:serine/threonine-protein phosphatase [Streptomyces sp. AD16]